MAKTKYVKVTGLIEWARVFPENRDMEGYKDAYEDCDGAYTLDLRLDPTEWDKVRASGSLKQGKRSDPEVLKVARKHKHPSGYEGLGGAPKVVHKDGSTWNFEQDGTIGNGSKCQVTLTVWAGGDTTITSFSDVKVLEHVEYDPDAGSTEPSEIPVETSDMEDEIPF